MEKKDFELIAGAIARSRMATELKRNAKEREAGLAGIRLVAIDFSATLKQTNPRFDADRFLAACGFSA